MSPAALAGFSAAWALFAEVMPSAADTTPDAIAARRARRRASAGKPAQRQRPRLRRAGHGDGRRQPGGGGRDLGMDGARRAQVVWPPELATHEVRPLDIGPRRNLCPPNLPPNASSSFH